MFAPRVFEAALKIDNRFAILPNRYRRAELAKFVEIFAKKRFEASPKFIRV